MMIDVFNHFMPKAYFDRLGALIPGHVAVTAFPRLPTLVDLDARLALLDQFDGLQQVLSLANPPLELIAAPDKTPELARIANDALAELCDKHPDRFPAFIASLPMNNVEASLAETDRAVKTLGARGIQVFTNVAGKPLSAPDLRPDDGARPAGLGASHARAEFSRLCERAGVGSGDLVQLRLALRDHRLHDAADLFGTVRRAARSQDHHPPHGRHDPLLRRPDRARLPPDLLRDAGEESERRGGRPEASADRLFQDALCRYRAQRRHRGDALRACVLRYVVVPVRDRRAVRRRARPRPHPQHYQGDRGASHHRRPARDDLRRQCAGAAEAAIANRGKGIGMKTQNIRVKLRDGEMGAYLAIPDRTPAGAIIAIMEIWGVNDTMRAHAHEFAQAGFVCLVPDLFWRQEPGVELSDHNPEHVKKAFDLYYDFDYDLAVRDMEDTRHYLEKRPECNGKVGAVGYCLGGKLCYLMCCRTDIDCAVAYYGTYIEHHIREAKDLHRPFVLHMALKDRWVQVEVNELLERRLSPNPLVTIHKYPGADHAFARHGGKTYSKPEADRALALTVDFFKRHLAAGA